MLSLPSTQKLQAESHIEVAELDTGVVEWIRLESTAELGGHQGTQRFARILVHTAAVAARNPLELHSHTVAAVQADSHIRLVDTLHKLDGRRDQKK